MMRSRRTVSIRMYRFRIIQKLHRNIQKVTEECKFFTTFFIDEAISFQKPDQKPSGLRNRAWQLHDVTRSEHAQPIDCAPHHHHHRKQCGQEVRTGVLLEHRGQSVQHTQLGQLQGH